MTLSNITLVGDVNFGDVWVLLMTKNYDQLEKMVSRKNNFCIFEFNTFL